VELREFIGLLSEQGCLRRISREVDWQYEIGEITRAIAQPLLFENIKDYPKQSVFTNGCRSFSSIGLALGLEANSDWSQVVGAARSRMARMIRPILVDSGPVMENVLQERAIDFLKLPVPLWSRGDGGRYIGTWHINVTRDPETSVQNVGIYRMAVLRPNQATVSATLNSHLSLHLSKAERAGRPLEMAVAIGVGEEVIMAAGAALPFGVNEYEFASRLQGEELQLIRCQTVNLDVPAAAEIVIEGVIHPRVRVHDGPYFDYAGRSTSNPNAYLFEATRLMFRNQPIFRGTAVGQALAEDQYLFSVLAGLGLFDFHGSRIRRKIQSQLISRRLFRAFQLAGRPLPSVRSKEVGASSSKIC
jgi:UbiD family decarboxylase